MVDQKLKDLVNEIETLYGAKVALLGERGEIIGGSLRESDLGQALEGIVRSTDRHSFATAMIKGDIDETESYKLASTLGIVDSRRVVYLFELASRISDPQVIDVLSSVFAESDDDFFCRIDDLHLCAIHSIDEDASDEEITEFALMGISTIETEAFVTTKCGISSVKDSVGALREGYEEAKNALSVMGLISEKDNVAHFDKMGIAGLVYELPQNVCERYIREIFGSTIKLDDMDEEESATLEAFYDNNLNISETARTLYLHRNTLVYRLEQISKKLGVDIRLFGDAMRLRTAMAVLKHLRRDF